jgi:hypothetical protein
MLDLRTDKIFQPLFYPLPSRERIIFFSSSILPRPKEIRTATRAVPTKKKGFNQWLASHEDAPDKIFHPLLYPLPSRERRFLLSSSIDEK